MTLEILKTMAKEGQIFSLDQLHQKTRIKKEILRVIVSRWEKKGFVERIERGTYLIIPLESEKGKYTVHEFVNSITSCQAICHCILERPALLWPDRADPRDSFHSDADTKERNPD